MILPGVDLPNRTAYTRFVLSDHHKQVFSHEALLFKGLNQFYVRESLPIGADFVLALDDKHPFFRSIRKASAPASLYSSTTASWYFLSVLFPVPLLR